MAVAVAMGHVTASKKWFPDVGASEASKGRKME
jgi:hypothetical protein